MMSQLEYAKAQVMQLTSAERNHLLERLISSLDTDAEVERHAQSIHYRGEAHL